MFISYKQRKGKIMKMATDTGWSVVYKKPENALFRFRKDDVVIDVWWTKMTIGVYVDDEDNSKYMYEFSEDDLFELFNSPTSYKHEGREKITRRWN